MNRIIYLLVYLISVSSTISAQTKNAFMEAGEKAFNAKNYYAALIYFDEALLFDKNDTYVLLKSAESARLLNSYKLAAERYEILVDSLRDVKDPTSVFWLASMHQKLGNYDKALYYYELYLTEHSMEEDDLYKKARKEIEACRWAREISTEPNEYITIERLQNDVNSVNSDFGAYKVGDTLYYSSHRFEEKNPVVKPGRNISKIMYWDGVDVIKPLPGVIEDKNISVAHTSFSRSGDFIYYSHCEYTEDNELRCDLYKAQITVSGEVKNEQKLPEPINLPGYSTSQPSTGVDPTTGSEILFFSSNRPGGKGKMDIWFSAYDPKLGFSAPVNIGTINTSEDDISPFYHQETNTLYFSSEGKIGLGGFDIYMSKMKAGEFEQSEILPFPVNSSYHDVFYFLNEKGNEAYLSSNREGSLYLDERLQACCFDIYKVEYIPLIINLNALTFCKITGNELHAATVKLIDLSTGEIVAERFNMDGNDHFFELDPNKDYQLVATRENYLPDTIIFSTRNIKKSEDLVRKMYLDTDMLLLDVFTFDLSSKDPLSGTTVEIEDLTDPSVPKIIELNELSNDFHFTLDRGKLYRITATKSGYTPAIEILDTRPYNSGGLINKNLYLDKFSLEALLPISLYFDNDYPDPKSKSTATSAVYGDLLRDYMRRKADFIKNYANSLTGQTKTKATDDLDVFFEGDVRGGYDKLNLFLKELVKELQSGVKVEITLKGFASPRFDTRYNLVLAQRRINSIRNEFNKYGNGVLAEFIKNRQLIITEVSYGDDLSKKDVVSDLGNIRESVFSVNASKERRVEIIKVKRLR